jgi:hypothetical protein
VDERERDTKPAPDRAPAEPPSDPEGDLELDEQQAEAVRGGEGSPGGPPGRG